MRVDNTFWKSVFSEPDGSGSSTRVCMASLISFVLGVGLAFGTGVIIKRITIEQFDDFLMKGGEFILTTCGPLYGANQVRNVMNTKVTGSSNNTGNTNGNS